MEHVAHFSLRSYSFPLSFYLLQMFPVKPEVSLKLCACRHPSENPFFGGWVLPPSEKRGETELWARTWKMKAVYIWKVPQRFSVPLVLSDKQKSLQRLLSGRAEWQRVGRLLRGDSSGVRDQRQRRLCGCRIQHITRLGRLRQIYSPAVSWLAPAAEIWVLIAALT